MSRAIENPELFASLDSFEGVPDFFEPRIAPESRSRWQRKLHGMLVWIGLILPGICLAWGLAWIGQYLSAWIGATVLRIPTGSPVSPILVAILLGLLIRNSIGVPTAYEHGLRMCIKNVLRIGIVLLGLKLTVLAIVEIGKIGIPIIVVCISVAILAVTFINRALGLPKRLGTLIAVGTSICGVSAIAAIAPVIEAEDDETSYAIATITLFGLIALFVYPFLAHIIFHGNQTQAGLFLGTAIHDTSQVAGAGLMYKQQYQSETALKIATAVKLMRNLAMSLLIPLMAIAYRNSTGSTGAVKKQKWHQAAPLFVIGFAAMAVIRSVGDLGGADKPAFAMMSRAHWAGFLQWADAAAVWCLTTAMAAVGLGTGLAKLRGLGVKPLSVGFAAALLVGGVSVALIKLLSPLLLTR
jgi:uncharacterized integral membrane protein (TIGR00698 family)